MKELLERHRARMTGAEDEKVDEVVIEAKDIDIEINI